ncbi:MAG: TVP38/TMEM64 family protein [Solirubrobacterales bacterium]
MKRLLTSPKLRLGLLAAILIAATVVAIIVGPSQQQLEELIDDTGLAGPLVYVALYAVLTVLMAPGAVITAAGGVLFGTFGGTALSVLGATAGALGSFVVARRLGRSDVEEIAGPRIERLDGWLRDRGFLAVLYVRLVPILPFNLLNYAAGVTAINRRDYLLGTVVGIIPGAFAFSALGSNLDEPTSPAFLGALGLIVVLAVGGTAADRRHRRRARTGSDID